MYLTLQCKKTLYTCIDLSTKTVQRRIPISNLHFISISLNYNKSQKPCYTFVPRVRIKHHKFKLTKPFVVHDLRIFICIVMFFT